MLRACQSILPGAVLVLFTHSLPAQELVEEFAAGFSDSLGWRGDTAAFDGEGGAIRLADERSENFGRAIVFLPAPTRDAACFRLSAALDFAPSPANRATWWLAAESPPLADAPPDGYYVGLGGEAGADDAFELHHRSGGEDRLVLGGTPGTAAAAFDVDLELCRTATGSWTLRAHDRSGSSLDSATAEYDAPLSGGYAGLDLRYTASRNGLFAFGRFAVSPLADATAEPDSDPPLQSQAVGRFELIISEIMADPTPVRGLPDAEYVEIHNPTPRPIHLAGVELRRGASAVRLPDTLLAAGAFLALTAEALDDDRLAVLPDLPTLTNSGAQLALLHTDGRVIDAVDYRSTWHAAGLRDGGTSLERLDLDRPCTLGAAAWASSTALAGGTPGSANSAVIADPIDGLRILSIDVLGDTALQITTNRVLHAPAADHFSLFGEAFGGSVARPSSVVEVAGELGAVELGLPVPSSVGEAGFLTLAPSAASCVDGEPVAADSVAFGVPARPLIGDWAISEIMYDPRGGEGRYVELANVSTELLSTGDVGLALVDARGGVVEPFETSAVALIEPGGFAVFADDAETLLARYSAATATKLVASDVPTLGEEGCLLLFDPTGERRLEEVCYSGDWHNRAYANTDGVALERLDAEAPGSDAANWTSAAASADGGTPTRGNSQSAGVARVLPEGGFALASERVSPDGDGYEDRLTVDFRLAEPGTLLSFSIVDLRGRTLYAPREDLSPGREGSWSWDGVDDDGAIVPAGTYVVRVSAFGDGRPERVEHLAFSVVGRM